MCGTIRSTWRTLSCRKAIGCGGLWRLMKELGTVSPRQWETIEDTFTVVLYDRFSTSACILWRDFKFFLSRTRWKRSSVHICHKLTIIDQLQLTCQWKPARWFLQAISAFVYVFKWNRESRRCKGELRKGSFYRARKHRSFAGSLLHIG